MVLETNHHRLNIEEPLGVSVSNSLHEKSKMSLAADSIDHCLEVVVDWIEKKAGKSYFVGPLEEFQARYGKVNPEDEFYQSRMNYFLEYCVLERPMTGRPDRLVPISIFFDELSELTQGDDANSLIWRNFSGFYHGIFQVLNSGEKQVEAIDLLTEKKFTLVSKAGETLKYLRKKTIFQGFLFGTLNRRCLGQGLIVHPELANKEVLKYIKKYRKYPLVSSNEVLRLMAQTNMRLLRMQHVNPAVIYQSISG